MITEFTSTVNPDNFGLVERSARQSFEAELAIKRPFFKSISARGGLFLLAIHNITAASLPDFSNYRVGRGQECVHVNHALKNINGVKMNLS